MTYTVSSKPVSDVRGDYLPITAALIGVRTREMRCCLCSSTAVVGVRFHELHPIGLLLDAKPFLATCWYHVLVPVADQMRNLPCDKNWRGSG